MMESDEMKGVRAIASRAKRGNEKHKQRRYKYRYFIIKLCTDLVYGNYFGYRRKISNNGLKGRGNRGAGTPPRIQGGANDPPTNRKRSYSTKNA